LPYGVAGGEVIEMKRLISVLITITALILPVATPAQAAWQMNQPVAGGI
jgi:hypothetical protein